MHTSNKLTDKIIEAIQDKKGKGITIIDLSHLEAASTDEYIICQGNSTSQVGAIADSIRDVVLESLDIKPSNYDGYRNCQWIVIDYGEIMVHIFLKEFRDLYNLEELWGDGAFREIPDID